MQTISDLNKSDNSIKHRIDSFSKKLELESFFLLIKPNKYFYSNHFSKKLIEKLVKKGLVNLEISWSDDQKWADKVSKIKLMFPKLNLGSASITNQKSIDESIKIGLGYSMMKFWDKDLLNYSISRNHLLIPGIKDTKEFNEAIDCNCKIIKIYPVKYKDESINISKYKNIDFIAAGGLSISDLPKYKSLGYKAIVIGDKSFINKEIDPNIYEYLKEASNLK